MTIQEAKNKLVSVALAEVGYQVIRDGGALQPVQARDRPARYDG